MIKTLITILFLGSVSFYYTDLLSESVLYSALLPVLFFFSLIAFAFWLITLLHNLAKRRLKKGISQGLTSNAGSPPDFSGDGSGGGDGC